MRAIVALTTALIFLVAGCTKYVVIPESDYDSIGEKGTYVVHTTDGYRYVSKDIDVTETGIVIRKIATEHKAFLQPAEGDTVQVPVALEWSEISQMEKINLNRGRMLLLLAGVFVVVLLYLEVSPLL